MDGRNGAVNIFVTNLPGELHWLVKQYQMDRRLPAFSYAIRELLETHPEIAKRASDLYARSDGEPC